MNYKGDILYFEEKKSIDDADVKERIGYTEPGSYFLPHWTVKQVAELSKVLFENFHEDRFHVV